MIEMNCVEVENEQALVAQTSGTQAMSRDKLSSPHTGASSIISMILAALPHPSASPNL